MIARTFAPTVAARRGKGPRTKAQVRRRRLAIGATQRRTKTGRVPLASDSQFGRHSHPTP